MLIDDPQLTVREVYRERPLTRVVFDRRLRVSPRARLFSTVQAGPVIIVTTTEMRQAQSEAVGALERAGAMVLPVDGAGVSSALRRLTGLGIQSVVIEGGAALHAAAWDEGVVDFVQLYVAPVALGHDGVPLLDRKSTRLNSSHT